MVLETATESSIASRQAGPEGGSGLERGVSDGPVPLVLEDVPAFVASLREEGWEIGPREMIAVDDLLLALIGRGIRPNSDELALWIAPVLCRKPEQQAAFATRIRAWSARRPPPISPGSPPATGWRDRVAAAVPPMLAATIVLGSLVVWFFRGSLARQVTTSAAKGEGGAWFILVSFVVVFLLGFFGAWLVWAYLRRARFLSARVPSIPLDPVAFATAGGKPTLVPKHALEAPARRLRLRQRLGATYLDVAASVRATLDRAGFFTPVEKKRFITPEYVILIDRRTVEDHQARFYAEIAGTLRRQSVVADVYYFDRDPRLLEPERNAELFLTLADLAARYPGRRLLILADERRLLDSFSGRPAAWISQFEPWTERAVATPVDPAPLAVESLAVEGFQVIPATEEGLETLFRSQAPDGEPRRRSFTSRPPRLLTERPTVWLSERIPPPDELRELLEELRRYLGQAGFYWLAACATYPQIRWRLTLHLGYGLAAVGGPLYSRRRLLSLAQLPWFREGRMPEWLRQELLGRLAEDQARAVRDAVDRLLRRLIPGGQRHDFQLAIEDPLSLDPERSSTFATLYQKERPGGVLREAVFASFMSDSLALKVPKRLRSLLFRHTPAAGRAIAGASVAVIAGVIAGVSAAFGFFVATGQAPTLDSLFMAFQIATVGPATAALAAVFISLGLLAGARIAWRFGIPSGPFRILGAAGGGGFVGGLMGAICALHFGPQPFPVMPPKIVISAVMLWLILVLSWIRRFVPRNRWRALFQANTLAAALLVVPGWFTFPLIQDAQVFQIFWATGLSELEMLFFGARAGGLIGIHPGIYLAATQIFYRWLSRKSR